MDGALPWSFGSSGRSGQCHHESHDLISSLPAFYIKVERAATESTVRETFLNYFGEALHFLDFLHIQRLSHLGKAVKQRPEAYQHLERARSNLLVCEPISLECLDGRGSN